MGWDFWTFKQAVNRPKFRSIPVYGPDFEPIRNALNARKLGPSFGPYTWLLTRLVARHSGDGGGGGFQQNERLVRRPPPSASAHGGGNSPPWPKSSANAGFFVGAASVRSGRTRRAARGGRRAAAPGGPGPMRCGCTPSPSHGEGSGRCREHKAEGCQVMEAGAAALQRRSSSREHIGQINGRCCYLWKMALICIAGC
uniref:Uncharacterized protein n=1 Tax=Oryza barthii TaxID=65489 RepID=A0A0D3HED3_9ORYZ